MRTSFGQWDAEIIFHAVSSTKQFDRSSAVSQLSISFIRLITGCVAAVIGMSLLSRWSTRSSRFPARYLYNAGQRQGKQGPLWSTEWATIIPAILNNDDLVLSLTGSTLSSWPWKSRFLTWSRASWKNSAERAPASTPSSPSKVTTSFFLSLCLWSRAFL